MTNPAQPPASRAPESHESAWARRRRRRDDTWYAVDVVCSVLLATGLLGVVAFSGFGLTLGIGMSGDGCAGGSGPNCVSSEAATTAWFLAMGLLLIAVVVGLGGLVRAAVRHRVLSWWPLGGYPIVVAAWLTAIAIID
ncbi:MAG TPA: hypothetical protein VG502_16030 [Flexivirga sp.]|uniref:hypothetical protein n=1 Tax=Flexivirga sp. TaxID=1962927 RepID=UPI002CE564AF|nr:hypothetical protein [Flexivirga sp.]HWC23804.1 hypothetical protein [Flexivirga sp.]